MRSDPASPGPPAAATSEARVLSYGTGRGRRGRLARNWHVWLLPLVWLPGSWGSRIYYGDEYVAFMIANAPSALVYVPVSKVIDLSQLGDRPGFFWTLIAMGVALWTFVGWLLDRVRGWRWMYLLMPVAFVAIVLSRVAAMGSVQPVASGPQHPPGQEWEWPSVFVAYCWAVYLIAVPVLLVAMLAHIARWLHRRVTALNG